MKDVEKIVSKPKPNIKVLAKELIILKRKKQQYKGKYRNQIGKFFVFQHRIQVLVIDLYGSQCMYIGIPHIDNLKTRL